MRVVLISTYELGRQPFGLASPAAVLRARGHEVRCVDLALDTLPSLPVREADCVAFYVPMHTATRLAAQAAGRVRALNPAARQCAYGLYAPLNADYLQSLGVETVIGGEFEAALAEWVEGRAVSGVCLDRLAFAAPDRSALPVLSRYAKLRVNGSARVAGYTEASRGCKHLCRHCPVVPVYRGTFRIVPPEVVLTDVEQQVASGAEHITFGDPDFLNGPGHARRVVEKLHARWPSVTYDITAKVEHLLRHRGLLPVFRDTGCLFVTTAVESLEDEVLAKLEKGHTRADFLELAALARASGLTLAPTFVPWTPWTTLAGYRDLLSALVDLDLVGAVAPVQLALRLLITNGSRLLQLPDVRALVGDYDPAALVWRWKHPDRAVDETASAVFRLVSEETRMRTPRHDLFAKIWSLVHNRPLPEDLSLRPRATIPYMDEPWFC